MKLTKETTDKQISKLDPPVTDTAAYHMDSEIKGFGLRVASGGCKTYVLRYRTKSGAQRCYNIGRHPAWGVKAARMEAKRLKVEIDRGADPHGEDKAVREAPTMRDLCQEYIEQHLSKKRASTQADGKSMIERDILPAIGTKKVAEVDYRDIEKLHRNITQGLGRVRVGDETRPRDRAAPYRANRVLALLSSIFALAIKLKMRPDHDNPARDGSIERNAEEKRKRYLKPEELVQLTKALAAHSDQREADVVRLLLLTGARLGEVLNMRWDQLGLDAGVWTKPASATKQKEDHEVALSTAAVKLLDEIEGNDDYVFPSHTGLPRADDFKRPWREIARAAGIQGLRLHDLRHSAASYLVSAGHSLPMIGSILGHSNVATTARYSHLLQDPQRAAVNALADIVTGKPSAEIVSIDKKQGA